LSPWESRQRGGLYYTRSRKEDGRVVREYIGGGVSGWLAALQDSQDRRQRLEQAACWKEMQEELDALEAPVDELAEASDLLICATFLASGFRRHNRGEWRKRREPREIR
jgi:hypothetical protein